MRPYLDRQAATDRSGVAAIGVAQEFQRVWTAWQRDTNTTAPQFTFAKTDRRVTCYYFYPSVDADGRRTPALRFGDPRVMALAGALTTTLLAATGITQQEPARLDDRLLHAPPTPPARLPTTCGGSA
jgi:hypothetical protein